MKTTNSYNVMYDFVVCILVMSDNKTTRLQRIFLYIGSLQRKPLVFYLTHVSVCIEIKVQTFLITFKMKYFAAENQVCCKSQTKKVTLKWTKRKKSVSGYPKRVPFALTTLYTTHRIKLAETTRETFPKYSCFGRGFWQTDKTYQWVWFKIFVRTITILLFCFL